jgi:branched-chain amino acid transport system ATP-binding protein
MTMQCVPRKFLQRRMTAVGTKAARASLRMFVPDPILFFGRLRSLRIAVTERARVELARALCTGPKVLLLDEVMAGLNPVEMQDIMQLIRSLRDDGITLLVIEHHMRAIIAVCDRILVFNFGRLLADGPPAQIAADPHVIEAYLGRSLEARR